MHCRGGGRWCGGYQNSFEVCQFRVLNVGILGIMLGLGLPWPKWPRIIKSCSDRLIPRAPLLGGSGLLEDILIDVLIIPMRFGVWALHLTRTPLIWAAWNGHEGVVKMLLARDGINPDTPDKLGQTPLCHAAENRHGGVVKILLGRDGINTDKPDRWGQTPLQYATINGHTGVIALLQLPTSATHNTA